MNPYKSVINYLQKDELKIWVPETFYGSLNSCMFVSRDNPPSTKTDDVEQQEAERKLQELKRRRNNAESEEFEKMKQKQHGTEAELEELKRKREERKKILEEEERQRKQEIEDKKAKDQVRMDIAFRNLL